MRSFKGCKTAALFVGSVVGAGFATGQEILLFFGDGGVLDLAVAALFMALCAWVFLNMGGKEVIKDLRLKVAADSVVALSSFAVYAAMIAAAEEVLSSLTGRAGWSAALAVFVMLFLGKRKGGIARLNLVAVPVMAGIILYVGFRFGEGRLGATFHPIKALSYGGMNLLFSAALMVKEGGSLTPKERRSACLWTGAFLFPMLLFMHRCVVVSPSPEMPFLAVASREGLGTLASVSLLLAILTTMASTAYLVTDRLTALTGDHALSVPLVTLLGILLSAVGFTPLVTYAYPVVSYLGLATALGGMGMELFYRFKLS